jgi:hypothetical protein
MPGAARLGDEGEFRAARGRQELGATRGLGPDGEQFTRVVTPYAGSRGNKSALERPRVRSDAPPPPEYVRRPKSDEE